MDIEFNPGRVSGPRGGQPIARQSTIPVAVGETTPFKRSQALERALREMSEVRPEKVREAKAKISDLQYPPMEVLDRIAHLLAMNIEN